MIVPDDYKTAKALQDELWNLNGEAGKKLDEYPKGPMGLTPDNIKFSEGYRKDKAEFDRTFKALREYNTVFVKKFKREIQQARKARFNNGHS